MEAIILKRHDVREVDQIVSLYTRDLGKVDALARGVKKIISKNAAHLEPFSYTWAEIIPGKEMSHLTTVQPIRSFSGIRHDLLKSMMAGSAVSLIDRLLDTGQPDTRLFQLLKRWLTFLDQAERVQPLLLDSLVMQVYVLLGLTPILDRCVVCEQSFQAMMKEDLLGGKKSGFYFAGGGLVCGECIRLKQDIGEYILTVGLKEVSDMALLLGGDFSAINAFQLPDEEGKRLHRLVYEFAAFHSEKTIPDWGNPLLLPGLATSAQNG